MVTVDSITPETEIRHLPAKIVQELCSLLDYVDMWKKIAEKIPTSLNDSTPLYTSQHISIIEKYHEGPTQTLLNDWGTHGRKRPTVQSLINILCDCELYMVADFLAVDILKGQSVYNQTSLTELINNTETNRSPGIDVSALQRDVSTRVSLMEFDDLKKITNEFNEKKLKDGGQKIGTGASCEVYLGVDDEKKKCAVKRLKIEYHEQFEKEVDLLSTCRHKNVITLFSASVSDSYLCLVYEYMANGALQDRLACLDETPSIPWKQRIQIAMDVSEGLVYIHEKKYVHRDVKSANILLDNQWVAKLGDFGIAHIGPGANETSFGTKNVVGTHVYMPHEAMFGVISSKLDTYSFGVVLLELLTGLKPINKETNESLIDYVMENCEDKNIKPLLDHSAGEWNHKIATEVYQIATECLESFRGNRPFMTDVLKQFQNLILK